VWLLTGTAFADIAFPARLDVAEREPGIYEITFSLPIVEGRKLRAQPLMPPTCSDVTPRVEGIGSSGYTSVWKVKCEPASLAGEAILIEGLLGTQTDLALKLTTRDGRTYSQILRPSRPGFLVPEPPSPLDLAVASIVAGVRRTIRHLGLWILLATAAVLGAPPRALAASAGAFALGHFSAQWLGGHGWLETQPLMRDALAWLTVAFPAVGLAGENASSRGWLQPLWATAALLGLLFGGAQPDALAVEGLSKVEHMVALVLLAVGTAAAILLMAAAAHELRMVIALAGREHLKRKAIRVFGYVVGALAVGLFLIQVAGLMVPIGDQPRASSELVLLALILGPTVVLAGWRRASAVVLFALLAVAGAILGLLRVPLPASSMIPLGTLLFLGTLLALDRHLPRRWTAPAAVAAALTHSWSTAQSLVENVSRSAAFTGGAVLIAICVFHASLAVTRDIRTGELPAAVRLIGAAVAILAVIWRLGEYRLWFEREVATEAALGLARLPLLAAVLAFLAVLLWPRRRRVARELGIVQRSSGLHWLLLGAAFLSLPFGTVAVRNPLFEPDAPTADDARLVVSRVLSDTYHAFNIGDENDLFDALAESVTGELVDDLFLDSRRRLKAGTREGTEITVRDVGVLEISEPLDTSGTEEGFSYDCRWQVIARVRHLQHVHHRQNIYSGVLTLRPEDGRWKIASVALASEDRSVVPWKPT
jgi:hydrogenase/urease accessory protein HupE